MSTYTRIGTEIGELVDQKNAAYGSSFAKAGEFLRLLWPDGLSPERYTDALLLVRIFDKQMRIATDRDAFGESPYRDIAGYGLLGAEMHEQREKDVSAPAATASVPSEEADPNTASNSFLDLAVARSNANIACCGSCGWSFGPGGTEYRCLVRGRRVVIHERCRPEFVQQLWRCDVSPSEVDL